MVPREDKRGQERTREDNGPQSPGGAVVHADDNKQQRTLHLRSSTASGRVQHQGAFKGSKSQMHCMPRAPGSTCGLRKACRTPVEHTARVQVVERQRDARRVKARLCKPQPPPGCLAPGDTLFSRCTRGAPRRTGADAVRAQAYTGR